MAHSEQCSVIHKQMTLMNRFILVNQKHNRMSPQRMTQVSRFFLVNQTICIFILMETDLIKFNHIKERNVTTFLVCLVLCTFLR